MKWGLFQTQFADEEIKTLVDEVSCPRVVAPEHKPNH